MDLSEGGIKNYPGNYDDYLEKKENPVTAGTSGAFSYAGASSAVGSFAKDRAAKPAGTGQDGQSSQDFVPVSDGKADYQRQKEEAARQRKRQNDIAKIEKRIEAIDSRMAELDGLLAQEEVYTDVARLMEINKEKTALDEELLELMEKWEELESQA